VHNLVRPEAAAQLGRRKADRIRATAPDLVATGNPGCLLQIRRHLGDLDDDTPVVHPIEIIDASIRGLKLSPTSRARSAAGATPATSGPAGNT
jgi:glycolate oxidase iron-sulfur subunit